MKKALQ